MSSAKVFTTAIIFLFASINFAVSKEPSIFDGFGPEVNGDLKDECAFLKRSIEVVIDELEKSNAGSDMGNVAELKYNLPSFAATYRNLCD